MFGEGEPFCVHVTGMLGPIERGVALIQRRVATDFPLPLIFRYFSWAAADFALVAHTADCNRQRQQTPQVFIDDQGILTGSVYLLQRNTGRAGKRMNRLRGRIRRILGRHLHESDLPIGLRKIVDSISEARQPRATPPTPPLDIPEAHFVLYRSGEFRLWMLPSTIPDQFDDDKGRPVPTAEAPQYKKAFVEGLSSHFYYFVRDMAHRHRHHAKGSDSLLPVVEATPTDDTTWRRETSYNLSRAIIEARRDDDLVEHKRAIGIAAYAGAYQDH